jgi:hypothetical protein
LYVFQPKKYKELKMGQLIGFCGLSCIECPAFIATQKDDDAERERVAKLWTKEYKHEFNTGDINCDGCVVIEGKHIGYCSECRIRNCAIEKSVKNCAYCESYICEKLNNLFDIAPHIKELLEKIRKGV